MWTVCPGEIKLASKRGISLNFKIKVFWLRTTVRFALRATEGIPLLKAPATKPLFPGPNNEQLLHASQSFVQCHRAPGSLTSTRAAFSSAEACGPCRIDLSLTHSAHATQGSIRAFSSEFKAHHSIAPSSLTSTRAVWYCSCSSARQRGVRPLPSLELTSAPYSRTNARTSSQCPNFAAA